MAAGVLEKFGLRRNWIYEVIVSTASGHSAPIGVWSTDLKTLKFRVYGNSRTMDYLLDNGFFVVKFPGSVLDFQKALSSKPVRGLSFLEMRVISKKKLKDSVEFRAKVINHRIKKNLKLFNRAESLALEYLIKTTKPKRTSRELSEYRRIVNKVAPGSVYSSIVK